MQRLHICMHMLKEAEKPLADFLDPAHEYTVNHCLEWCWFKVVSSVYQWFDWLTYACLMCAGAMCTVHQMIQRMIQW